MQTPESIIKLCLTTVTKRIWTVILGVILVNSSKEQSNIYYYVTWKTMLNTELVCWGKYNKQKH